MPLAAGLRHVQPHADHVSFEFDASLLNDKGIQQVVCETFKKTNEHLIHTAQDLSNFVALDKDKVEVNMDNNSRLVTCTVGYINVVVEGIRA